MNHWIIVSCSLLKLREKNAVNAGKSELRTFALNVMINVAWYHTLSLLSLYLFFLPSRKKCNMTTSVNLEYKLQRFYWRFKNNSPKTIHLTLLHLYLGYVLDYYSSKYKDYHHYDFPHLNIPYLHTCLCLAPPSHQ